jgi:hypothetical protein
MAVLCRVAVFGAIHTSVGLCCLKKLLHIRPCVLNLVSQYFSTRGTASSPIAIPRIPSGYMLYRTPVAPSARGEAHTMNVHSMFKIH